MLTPGSHPVSVFSRNLNLTPGPQPCIESGSELVTAQTTFLFSLYESKAGCQENPDWWPHSYSTLRLLPFLDSSLPHKPCVYIELRYMKSRHTVDPGFTFSVLSRNPVCFMKLLISLRNNPAPLLQPPQVLRDLGHHLVEHKLWSNNASAAGGSNKPGGCSQRNLIWARPLVATWVNTLGGVLPPSG